MYIVSCCLLGINCKYSGGNNLNENVIKFLEGKEYIAVCPEKCGGLKVPRVPSERLNDRVISKDNVDVTEAFFRGAEMALKNALSYSESTNDKIEFAILKANSPSCGKGTIYDGTFAGKLIEGNGVFTDMLLEHGITVKTEKEI